MSRIRVSSASQIILQQEINIALQHIISTNIPTCAIGKKRARILSFFGCRSYSHKLDYELIKCSACQSRVIREAPLKLSPGLFGHCPNSDCTPTVKRALYGIFFRALFYHFEALYASKKGWGRRDFEKKTSYKYNNHYI